MKSHTILTGLVVLLLAGNIWQFIGNHTLRSRVAELDGSVAVLTKETASAKEELVAAQKREAILKADNIAAEQKIRRINATAQTSQAAAPETDPADSAETAPKKPAKGFMGGLAEMMKNPETRKAMRAQQMFGVRMFYGDLVKSLHLDSAKGDQLLEILLDQQMETMEASFNATSGTNNNSARFAEARQQAEKRLDDLLGPEGKSKVLDYQSTMGERFMLNQFVQQVGGSELKMSDQQSQGLLQIMLDEKKKQPALARASSDPAEQAKLMSSEQALADFQKSQSEYYERVIARATPILAAPQIEQFKKFLKQMQDMQKAGAAMAKQMQGDAGGE